MSEVSHDPCGAHPSSPHISCGSHFLTATVSDPSVAVPSLSSSSPPSLAIPCNPPPVSPSRAGTPYLAWETLSWLIVWHGFFGFIHSPSLLRYHFHNVCQGNRHPGSFQSVSDSSRHLDSQAPPPVPVPKRTVIGSVMPKQFRPTRVWVKGGLGTGKALES